MMAEKDNDDSNSNSFAAGRIQLWQFLLKLLVDRTKFSLISWSGTEGEFDILQPDEVARLWSEQKGAKGSGNFANLQRSLRTYYSQGLLTKVAGYQYRYRFTFDSKSFLGYSFEELSNLVMSFESSSAHLLPTLTN